MVKTRTASPQNDSADDLFERTSTLSIDPTDEEMQDAPSHSVHPSPADAVEDNTYSDPNTDITLQRKYELKIESLHHKILDLEDPNEIQRNNILIKELQTTLDTLTGKDTTDTIQKNYKDVKRKIPTSELPIFQLHDDPADTKVDNKVSFENAESFIAAFETIIKINLLDINTAWQTYIPECFLFSKNKTNSRWYHNTIDPLIDTDIKWDVIKEKIILRFGDCATNTNKFKKYINIKQDRQETIKDYIDRFLETYKRLPVKEPSNMIQVAHFIDSLLPKTKEEVENCLKRHKQGNKMLYPQDLDELFDFLEKNIGDIQEALYIHFTTGPRANRRDERDNYPPRTDANDRPQNKRESNGSYHDNANKKSRNDAPMSSTATKNHTAKNEHNTSTQDNQPYIKNRCGYCREKEYSANHLKECVPYLNSDRYKQKIRDELNREKRNN